MDLLCQASRRRWAWLFIWTVLLGSAVATAPRVSLAQGEKVEEKRDLSEKGPEKKEAENFAVWVIRISGLIGAFILVLSMYFVATVIRLFLEIRPQVLAPSTLIGESESLLEQRQFKEVFAAVENDDSFYGRALSTGIRELPNGLAEARDAMERVGESMTADLEKKISMLAVLGTLGPMIGLLGTLKGMIASFGEISRSGEQLKADKVAEGISEALVLTFEGVILSVPAIFFFALFRNRITSLTISTMLQADEFLRRFAHLARSKAPPAAAAAVAAKPAGKA